MRPGDLRGRVARAVVDHQDVGRQAGHLGRDLGQDARQVVGLVVGRDAHEHAAERRAGQPGRLDLGGRQRPDEPAHPLVGPVGPGEGVEDEQVGERDADDEDGDQPAERLAGQPEDVLDRPDEVGHGGDRDQPEPDDEEPGRRHAAAAAGAPQPPDRQPDEEERRAAKPTIRRRLGIRWASDRRVAERRRLGRAGSAAGASWDGPRSARLAPGVAAAHPGAGARLGRSGRRDSPASGVRPAEPERDPGDGERDRVDLEEQERVVERGGDRPAEECPEGAGRQPARRAGQRRRATDRTNAMPSSPATIPSSANSRIHSLCGEPRTWSP